MDKPKQCCDTACKDGKHCWEGKKCGSYNKTKGKIFYDDWECRRCGDKISGSCPQCKTCYEMRPHRTDWYCKAHDSVTPCCNYLNHSSRTECRKCNKPKRAFFQPDFKN